MQNLTFSNPDNTREQTVIDLTSFMVHKHYCENDVEAIISLFDEDFHWLGAAEQGCRLLTCNQVIAQMLGKTEEEVQSLDWSEGFSQFIDRADLPKLRASLNRLRKPGDQTSVDYQLNCPGQETVNDKMGHIAGDELIRRTAAHISQLFPRKAYRIGGDEFIILDDQLQEKEFRAAVASLCSNMYQYGIQISAGCSWRSSVNASEQLNEADVNMYLDKKQFYKKQKTVSES